MGESTTSIITKITKITNLIDKNRWNDILDLIKKNKVDPTTNISETTLIHLASANNQKGILQHISKKEPSIFKTTDKKGDTPLHVLANYGYISILKKILTAHPKLINLTDGSGATITNILATNKDFLDWVINNNKFVDLNAVDGRNETVLTKNIITNPTTVSRLLKKDINLAIPESDPPIFKAVETGNLDAVKLLKENGANLNVRNKEQLTPLLVGIFLKKYDIVEYLVDNGVNLDYMGPENDHNPLVLAGVRKDEQLINFLLNRDIDVDKFDRYMNTSLHNLFSIKTTPETVAKLIYYGNLNLKNIKKETPLHILLKNYNWKNYDQLLNIKNMDIFAKDSKGRTPLDYIKTGDLPKFLNMVADHLFNKINKDGSCAKESFEKKICMNHIKRFMMEHSNSNPANQDLQTIKLNFIKGEYSNFGKFNSDTLHSMIYTIIMLKKYQNIGIPFKFYFKHKSLNEKLLLITNDLFISPTGKIISDIVKIYTNYFYEIAPYVILWRSEHQYFIDKDLDFYVLKCLNNDKIRFIFLKLTLIASEQGTHANIIIFDKKTGIVERFEPYGTIPYLNVSKLDKILEKHFIKILRSSTYKTKITYLSSKDLNSVSFQTVSNDTEAANKKLGDPLGYCLAWTFWYLEMRINNPDIHPIELIKKAKYDILHNSTNKTPSTPFMDFIRGYANKLDIMKNKFFEEAGVDKDNFYNMVTTDRDRVLIAKKLASDFKQIVGKQYDLKS